MWPNLMQPIDDVLAVARHCDESGWDGIWVADHFMGDDAGFGAADSPTLEATAVLSTLAAITRRLRIGPLVLGATYRHPAVVAKWAVTTDRIAAECSDDAHTGRLVLGLGAGWQQNEHDQYGIELPTVRDRVSRFGEYCHVITSLLGATPADFDGDWFHLEGALCEPKAIRSSGRPGGIPIMIGGKGDRMLGVAARYGDEWNMWGLPERIAERAEVLDQTCVAIGRDPATVARSAQALLLPTADDAEARRFVEAVAPRAAVAGPVERIGETVGRWAEVGVTEVIVPDSPLGRGAQRAEHLDALAEVFAPYR